MFARAGISSRAFRGEHSGGFFGRPKKKKKEKKKFRCYVPFMWPACIAVCCGLLVLCGGTAMCVTGYYARNFTSTEVTNGTDTWYEIDRVPYTLMWNMTYVGPVLMGFGCFTIVIACVVVCETRDKMIKIIEDDEKKGKKTVTKPDFYDLVIKRLRKDTEACLGAGRRAEPGPDGAAAAPSTQPPRRKSIFNVLLRRSSLKSIKSTKSEFAHIGSALRQIPMQIFAIEIEHKKKSSLLPLTLTLGVDIGRKRIPVPDQSTDDNNLYLVPKYPSASCIVDLLRLNDEKLNSLFPDMNSWLAEVQPLSKKWKKMTRNSLVPFPNTCATHSESRDADESDTDSLCSVTVHVQAEKNKPKCQLTTITRSVDDDGRIFGMPSNSARGSSTSVRSQVSEDQYGRLTVPGQERLNRDAAGQPNSADGKRPSSRQRRRSLLRQQRVVEDLLPPPPTSAPGDPRTGSCHESPDRDPAATNICDTNEQNDKDISAAIVGRLIGPDRYSDPSRPKTSPGYPRRTHKDPLSNDLCPERCPSGKPEIDKEDALISPDKRKPNIRKLFCSEDNDDGSPETRKLLGSQSADRDSSPIDHRRSRVHQSDGGLLHKRDSSLLFTPYTPTESNARRNSDMKLPAVNTCTPPRAPDLTVLNRKLNASHCLGPRSMTSQLRYESECPPADHCRIKKSKTVSGFTKIASP